MQSIRRIRSALVVGVIGMGAVIAGAGPAAGAVEVSTEAELRAAWATATSIELADDITLTDCTGGGAVERTSTAPVVLHGDGHTIRQTCADNDLVQETVGAGLVTLQHVTLTGGSSTSSGGGIFAQSDLRLVHVTLHDNHANAFGGGLATLGVLSIEQSTVRDNNASLGGGGVAAGLSVTVVASTIANNLGGGLSTLPDGTASAVFVNSTVTGNRNADNGAGIFSGGTVTLVYTSVIDNVADVAFDDVQASEGGLHSFASVVFTSGSQHALCLSGPGSETFGYNYAGDDTCSFTGPTDREDLTDPELGSLRDNGGPTPTLLPDDDSPLVDAIPEDDCQDDGASDVDTDQRGVERPQDDRCDIGAVELEEDPEPVPTTAPGPVVVAEPTFTG